MIKNKFLKLTGLFASAIIFSNFVFALPAEQNQLRIETGLSKRKGDTAFSTLVSWRKGGDTKHRANGLVFINGFTSRNPTSAITLAKKAAKSLNAGINYDAPHARGAIARFIEGEPTYLVSNRAGFDLAYVTTRDYSNQKLHYDIPNGDFNTTSIDVAIDIVYSAAVEYIDNFSRSNNKGAAGGIIRITLDNNPPIEIKTVNKSTKVIEKEIAEAIGTQAQFSSTPLYPNFVTLKSRNYKSFDDGEVQMRQLKARSITIDVQDSGLGVLTKFKFPDVNESVESTNTIFYLLGFLMAGCLGYIVYKVKLKTA
ncbi:MAG: hypothetical protein Q9M50_13480 [Methylococcales bacterium]|nr:hypothetical protein [Methylococcales bacterium]